MAKPRTVKPATAAEKAKKEMDSFIANINEMNDKPTGLHFMKLNSLIETAKDGLEDNIEQWFTALWKALFNEDRRIRGLAQTSFTNIVTTFTQNGSLHRQLVVNMEAIKKEMLRLYESGEGKHILGIWKDIVKFLGEEMHKNRHLVNILLVVIEKTFKSSSLSVQVAAFECWKALIENFSLNPEVLVNPKRIKLMLQPFNSNKTGAEEVLNTKINCWWFLSAQLGDKMFPEFDKVCLPLLNQSFHVIKRAPSRALASTSTSSSSSGTTTGGSTTTSTTTPPSALKEAVQFESIQRKGCEILMRLFELPPGVASPKKSPKLGMSPLKMPLPNSVFSKYVLILLDLSNSALLLLNNNNQTAALSQHLLTLLIQRVASIQKDETNEAIETVSLFLQFVQKCVRGGSVPIKDSLKLIDDVTRGLPSKVFESHCYHRSASSSDPSDVMNGVPALDFSKLLLEENLFSFLVAKDHNYTQVFSRLISAGTRDPLSSLKFLQSVFELLEAKKCLDLTESEIGPLNALWISTANHLWLKIEDIQDVNQGDTLEHDFSCVLASLVFPLRLLAHYPDFVLTNFSDNLKQWENVARSLCRFASAAGTSATAGASAQGLEPNLALEELCAKMAPLLSLSENDPSKKKQSKETGRFRSASFYDYLSQSLNLLIDCVDFQSVNNAKNSPGPLSASSHSASKRKSLTTMAKPLGNLSSFVALVSLSTVQILEMMEEETSISSSITTPGAPGGSALNTPSSRKKKNDFYTKLVLRCMALIKNLFGRISKSLVVERVFSELAPAMVKLFSHSSSSAVSSSDEATAAPPGGGGKTKTRASSSLESKHPHHSYLLAIVGGQHVAKLEDLWQTVVGCILVHYQGYHNTVLFDVVRPLLEVTLTHPQKTIVEKSRQLWVNTFGTSYHTIKFPESFKEVLRKMNPPLVPGYAISSEDASEPLLETSASTSNLDVSILGTSISNKSRSSSRPKPASKKIRVDTPIVKNIEWKDTSSSDFVPITTPKRSAPKSLTKRQKEALQKKSFVPALYNDLSQSTQIEILDSESMDVTLPVTVAPKEVADINKEAPDKEDQEEARPMEKDNEKAKDNSAVVPIEEKLAEESFSEVTEIGDNESPAATLEEEDKVPPSMDVSAMKDMFVNAPADLKVGEVDQKVNEEEKTVAVDKDFIDLASSSTVMETDDVTIEDASFEEKKEKDKKMKDSGIGVETPPVKKDQVGDADSFSGDDKTEVELMSDSIEKEDAQQTETPKQVDATEIVPATTTANETADSARLKTPQTQTELNKTTTLTSVTLMTSSTPSKPASSEEETMDCSVTEIVANTTGTSLEDDNIIDEDSNSCEVISEIAATANTTIHTTINTTINTTTPPSRLRHHHKDQKEESPDSSTENTISDAFKGPASGAAASPNSLKSAEKNRTVFEELTSNTTPLVATAAASSTPAGANNPPALDSAIMKPTVVIVATTDPKTTVTSDDDEDIVPSSQEHSVSAIVLKKRKRLATNKSPTLNAPNNASTQEKSCPKTPSEMSPCAKKLRPNSPSSFSDGVSPNKSALDSNNVSNDQSEDEDDINDDKTIPFVSKDNELVSSKDETRLLVETNQNETLIKDGKEETVEDEDEGNVTIPMEDEEETKEDVFDDSIDNDEEDEEEELNLEVSAIEDPPLPVRSPEAIFSSTSGSSTSGSSVSGSTSSSDAAYVIPEEKIIRRRGRPSKASASRSVINRQHDDEKRYSKMKKALVTHFAATGVSSAAYSTATRSSTSKAAVLSTTRVGGPRLTRSAGASMNTVPSLADLSSHAPTSTPTTPTTNSTKTNNNKTVSDEEQIVVSPKEKDFEVPLSPKSLILKDSAFQTLVESKKDAVDVADNAITKKESDVSLMEVESKEEDEKAVGDELASGAEVLEASDLLKEMDVEPLSSSSLSYEVIGADAEKAEAKESLMNVVSTVELSSSSLGETGNVAPPTPDAPTPASVPITNPPLCVDPFGGPTFLSDDDINIVKPSANDALSNGQTLLSQLSQSPPLAPSGGKKQPMRCPAASPLSRSHQMLQAAIKISAANNKKTGSASPSAALASAALACSPPSRSPSQPKHFYSPNASPSAGILKSKRKSSSNGANSGSEPLTSASSAGVTGGPKNAKESKSPSPNSKLRRVSFADPPVQWQVEIGGVTNAAKNVAPSASRCLELPAKLMSISSKTKTTMMEQGDGQVEEEESLGPNTAEIVDDLASNGESTKSPRGSGADGPFVRGLDKCSHPVKEIAHLLTSNFWSHSLTQLLEGKGLSTVAQLAQIDLARINSLAIQEPKIETLKTALATHIEKCQYYYQPPEEDTSSSKEQTLTTTTTTPNTTTTTTTSSSSSQMIPPKKSGFSAAKPFPSNATSSCFKRSSNDVKGKLEEAPLPNVDDEMLSAEEDDKNSTKKKSSISLDSKVSANGEGVSSESTAAPLSSKQPFSNTDFDAYLTTVKKDIFPACSAAQLIQLQLAILNVMHSKM